MSWHDMGMIWLHCGLGITQKGAQGRMHTKEHWCTSMRLHGPHPELAVVGMRPDSHILSWLRWACAQMVSACSLVALVFLGGPGLLLDGPG